MKSFLIITFTLLSTFSSAAEFKKCQRNWNKAIRLLESESESIEYAWEIINTNREKSCQSFRDGVHYLNPDKLWKKLKGCEDVGSNIDIVDINNLIDTFDYSHRDASCGAQLCDFFDVSHSEPATAIKALNGVIYSLDCQKEIGIINWAIGMKKKYED